VSAWRQKFPPWLTLILLGLGLALSLPGDTALYVALPTHTAQAGIALAQVGLMLSANRLIRLLINAPYGMLIERIPRRWMLVPSLLIGPRLLAAADRPAAVGRRLGRYLAGR